MYGLVLEGGGAKGSYQVGAMQALKELDIPIKGVAGTSIGALNGAMFVQGKLQEVHDLWYNISPSSVFDIKEEYLDELRNFSLNQDNLRYFVNKIKEILNNGGLDTSLLREIIANNIDENLLRKSELEFGMVTVSLSDFKPLELFLEDIPEGKVEDYLLASAYLPAFKMEKLDGKLFLDGGFYDKLPIKLLKNRGYKKLIAIRTYGLGKARKVSLENIEMTFIRPNEDLGRTLDFDQKSARRNIKLGYYDTMRIFKDLTGSKFYLKKKANDYYMDFFLKLGEEKINKVANLLGIKNNLPWRRSLFEEIIPSIFELLDLEKQANYQDMLVELAEQLAIKAELEQFNIYDFAIFISEIKQSYLRQKELFSPKLPRFFRYNKILPRQLKDELVMKIAEIIIL